MKLSEKAKKAFEEMYKTDKTITSTMFINSSTPLEDIARYWFNQGILWYLESELNKGVQHGKKQS